MVKKRVKYRSFLGFLGTIKYLVMVHLKWFLLARFGDENGVSRSTLEAPVIVTLTSHGKRIKTVYLCIETLLRQSVKPDRIILWISEHESANHRILKRQQRRGLEIRYCKDIRSYKKIIYAIQEFPDAFLVIADDDCYYPKDWLKELVDECQKNPRMIYCHRAHLMKYDQEGKLLSYKDWDYGAVGFTGPSRFLFPTGVGGVIYPPGSFHPEVLNERVFMELCPTADDVWLKAMSLLQGMVCKKVRPVSCEFIQIQGTQETSLWRENVIENKNYEQIKKVFERYGLI